MTMGKSEEVVSRDEIARLHQVVAERDAEIVTLKYNASHDRLTSMLNRHGFDEKVRDWIASGVEEITVGMADMDDFKLVNDTRGHAYGDDVLCKIGVLLHNIATIHGGIAARLSGDEFVVACPGRDWGVGQHIVNELEECAFACISMGIAVGAILGVANLMWSADVAMYHSKHTMGSSFTVWKEGDKLPAPVKGPDRRKRNREAAREQWHYD